jgi:ubiquitin-like protein Pup
MSEQAHAQRTERANEAVEEVANEAGKAAVAGAQEASSDAGDFLNDMDALLADIDESLGTEETAEDFVKNYRQKGGQ